MNTFLKFALLQLANNILLLRCYEPPNGDQLSQIEESLRSHCFFSEGEIKRFSFYKQKLNTFFINTKNKKELYLVLNKDVQTNVQLITYEALLIIYYLEHYYSTDTVIEDEYSNLIKLKNYLVGQYV